MVVIGLVIASFFIGSTYTKIQYLEKNSAPAQAVAQAAVPQQGKSTRRTGAKR